MRPAPEHEGHRLLPGVGGAAHPAPSSSPSSSGVLPPLVVQAGLGDGREAHAGGGGDGALVRVLQTVMRGKNVNLS